MLENFCIEHSGAFCEFPCSFRAGAAGLPGASPCHEYPYGCWHRVSWHIAATWRQPQTEPHSLSLSKCLSFAGVRLLAFGKSNVYLFVCRIASCFRKLIESLLKLFAWPSFTEDLVPVGLERNCNEGWDQIEALRPGRMIPLCRFNSLPNWQA